MTLNSVNKVTATVLGAGSMKAGIAFSLETTSQMASRTIKKAAGYNIFVNALFFILKPL
jgi:hypothetical protein